MGTLKLTKQSRENHFHPDSLAFSFLFFSATALLFPYGCSLTEDQMLSTGFAPVKTKTLKSALIVLLSQSSRVPLKQ